METVKSYGERFWSDMRRIIVTENDIRAALESERCLDGAASLLGVSKATLCRHMAKYGIRSNPIDASVGKKMFRWTVISVSAGTKYSKRKAICKCECGTVKELYLSSVLSGTTKSCGCFSSEVTTARSTKHGMYGTPEYNSWMGMKQRCNDPAADNYPWYGALGVKVCERWLESFDNFLADMGKKPSPVHSIDRIDPFGDYEPGNCKWSTKVEQANNTRRKRAASSPY